MESRVENRELDWDLVDAGEFENANQRVNELSVENTALKEKAEKMQQRIERLLARVSTLESNCDDQQRTIEDMQENISQLKEQNKKLEDDLEDQTRNLESEQQKNEKITELTQALSFANAAKKVMGFFASKKQESESEPSVSLDSPRNSQPS